MIRQDYWVGIDAGHYEAAICLIGKDGTILMEGMRDAQPGPIGDVLRLYGVERVQRVLIEAGVGTHIAHALRARGFPVQVVDVRRSSKFLAVRRHKTDANDARGLAELGMFGRSISAEVFLKPPDFQTLRTRLGIRRSLTQSRVRTDATIRSILQSHGLAVRMPRSAMTFTWEIQRYLASQKIVDSSILAHLSPLIEIAEQIRGQLKAIDSDLRSLAASNPVTANFQTMPGVGPITALSFYSTVCDPWRFRKNRNIGAYLGLVPTLHQSGTMARRGRVGRHGNKPTRTCLTTGATLILTQCKSQSRLRDWGLSMVARAGFTKAKIAVARKMAVILLQMWKSGCTFRPT